MLRKGTQRTVMASRNVLTMNKAFRILFQFGLVAYKREQQ
jgi:hypothetical protein